MVNFKLLLDLAIQLNQESRSRVVNQLYLSESEYLREYGTIRLDIGRQVGKTSTIKAVATKDDLIIVTNYASIQSSYKDLKSVATVMVNYSESCINKEKRFERIFIEEPSFMEKETLSKIYEKLSKDYFQTFILIGC